MRCLHIATKMSLLIASVVNVSTGILCRRCFYLIWCSWAFGDPQALAMTVVYLLQCGFSLLIHWFVWLWEHKCRLNCSKCCQTIFKTHHYSDQEKSSVSLTAILPSPQWFCVFIPSISLRRQWPFTLWFHLRNVNMQGKWNFGKILHIIVQNTLNE